MKSFDVVIIGAGTAGLAARREVAKKTDNYIVVDPGPLGTTCARVGCMPSKVLLQAANDFHRRHKFEELGISGAEALTIDTKKVMRHVRKLRDRFVRAVNNDMSSWVDTHLVRKRARFISATEIDLEGEVVTAKKVIIAAGSRPVVPQSWMQYKDYFLDTDQFFELEDLPKKVAVIGLGVIGLELGQALNRLGVEVIAIGNTPALGGLSDPKIQEYALKVFSEEMQISLDGAEIEGATCDGVVIKSGDKKFVVDKVLLAMGRRPNLDSLGLEKLNLDWTDRKIPVYDDTTFSIKGTNLYIAGDVNADRPLLHEAADQGRVAGYNAVREESHCFTRRTPLAIAFSYPNIASVGKNFASLKNRDLAIGEVSYEGQGRAIVMLQEKGLVRIYADRQSGKLLGAEIFAPSGEHLAHLLSWAITLELTAPEALSLPFYHPVLEEGLRTALRQLVSQLDTKPEMELFRCADFPFDRA
ncbi:MAG: dihydrolipoyl dehydrogenase [Bdellovibrionales bacterium]|nr:dihydrolipoyl dehydrogenase [Bdellovibrionales bacterium]